VARATIITSPSSDREAATANTNDRYRHAGTGRLGTQEILAALSECRCLAYGGHVRAGVAGRYAGPAEDMPIIGRRPAWH
jgi:hypothetical protein